METLEFYTIIAASYATDYDRYWYLRNGGLEDQILSEIVEEALS